MEQYLKFLDFVLKQGCQKKDRTGVGTLSVFGYDMRFDLTQGFPLLTTKKLHTKSIIYELLWFLRGETNVQFLHNYRVSIWDEWANSEGDLGPIYGKQWRQWSTLDGNSIDQMTLLIEQLKTNPDSRRHIVSAWNVGDLDKMALPPCHLLMQFYVYDRYLSCKLTQRSADIFLGVPFNIASYALLTHMIAEQCHLIPKELIWSGGDCHIYLNHLEQAKQQLIRSPRSLPRLIIKRHPPTLYDYCFEDFAIVDYHPYDKIEAPIAI